METEITLKINHSDLHYVVLLCYHENGIFRYDVGHCTSTLVDILDNEYIMSISKSSQSILPRITDKWLCEKEAHAVEIVRRVKERFNNYFALSLSKQISIILQVIKQHSREIGYQRILCGREDEAAITHLKKLSHEMLQHKIAIMNIQDEMDHITKTNGI